MDGREAPPGELVRRLSPCDLVLVEGFKSGAQVKLEVHRSGVGKAPLYLADPCIVGVASDGDLVDRSIRRFDLEDVEGIADFLVERAAPLGPGHD